MITTTENVLDIYHVPCSNVQGAGFINYSAAGHRGLIHVIYLNRGNGGWKKATTQTSRQSRQLQRTKLLTVSFSACRILMRRRCHGKHQQLSRQEKTLLFCRPPWKPPHTHTRARHAWRLTSDYSVWENRKAKRGDEDSGAHLELLVSLSSPVERLDVAAVNHQSFVTVSDGVSVLLHWQVTQRPVNTHTHTHTIKHQSFWKGFPLH